MRNKFKIKNLSFNLTDIRNNKANKLKLLQSTITFSFITKQLQTPIILLSYLLFIDIFFILFLVKYAFLFEKDLWFYSLYNLTILKENDENEKNKKKIDWSL